MPVYNRLQLRAQTGQIYLRDQDDIRTNTALTVAAGTVGFAVLSANAADPAVSGNGLYEGAWLKVCGVEYHVASFNVASGAFWSAQQAQTIIPTGTLFEIHRAIGPNAKDEAINETVKRIRVRREIGLTGVAGRLRYSLDGAASPGAIESVLDVYWLEDPGAAAAQKRQRVVGWQTVITASGHELRIDPPVASGASLIVDAAVEVSLGVADGATVNVPDDRWIAIGAAAQCLWQMERRTGPEGVIYRQARAEMEAEFKRLTAQFGAYGWAEGKDTEGLDGPPVAPSPATHEPF